MMMMMMTEKNGTLTTQLQPLSYKRIRVYVLFYVSLPLGHSIVAF